ncbi:MAG: DUF3160 domain-containing protein [Candidatus Kariarchaeaceae archaeon]|jgi:hypothetical protein
MQSKVIAISSAVIISILAISIFNFVSFDKGEETPTYEYTPNINGSVSSYVILNELSTSFGTYSPKRLNYQPNVVPKQISLNLANVDLQGLSISDEIMDQLVEFGFALVDEGYEEIYDIYRYLGDPKFVTTDLVLHAYHVLYDISLRILEGVHFSDDFKTMLDTLRNNQLTLSGSVSESSVSEAVSKNIAYLSVMLYLIDNTTTIPSQVAGLVEQELKLIDAGIPAASAIFGYEEDYTQYKVRGHYTRNEILGNYFKAMMYAGRLGFQLQSPMGDPEMGIEQTRMAMLLISSFNASVDTETVWDYWDRVYEPTVFYVGASDDLTALEYYTIWQDNDAPTGDELAPDEIIQGIIDQAKTYRKPKINSMFIYDTQEAEEVNQGFRLMGQRFIPDSYIFQQLIHDKVSGRLLPNGLDVFSVFGSSRAAFHLQGENATYPDYTKQVLKLRVEFNNLTDYDWTQNLYWLWLYSLFPLLNSDLSGYPGFMQSDAWLDKALMTTMGSWAELRHDTILYAKQAYGERTSLPPLYSGYVEPYPEVYSRLSSLVKLMKIGLGDRGLTIAGFSDRLDSLAEILDKLTDLSIKELTNQELTEEDYQFINGAGRAIKSVASFTDPAFEDWVSEADERMAIVADVATDPNAGQVLEVATGNPYTIYVIVQDDDGNLRLTKGGTFSYYEFKQPMDNRLSDEEWHTLLDSSPPELPVWMSTLPFASQTTMNIRYLSIKDE